MALKSVVPESAVAASTGNLLEMYILSFHLRPTKSEPLGVGRSNLCFQSFSGDSDTW